MLECALAEKVKLETHASKLTARVGLTPASPTPELREQHLVVETLKETLRREARGLYLTLAAKSNLLHVCESIEQSCTALEALLKNPVNRKVCHTSPRLLRSFSTANPRPAQQCPLRQLTRAPETSSIQGPRRSSRNLPYSNSD